AYPLPPVRGGGSSALARRCSPARGYPRATRARARRPGAGSAAPAATSRNGSALGPEVLRGPAPGTVRTAGGTGVPPRRPSRVLDGGAGAVIPCGDHTAARRLFNPRATDARLCAWMRFSSRFGYASGYGTVTTLLPVHMRAPERRSPPRPEARRNT